MRSAGHTDGGFLDDELLRPDDDELLRPDDELPPLLREVELLDVELPPLREDALPPDVD